MLSLLYRIKVCYAWKLLAQYWPHGKWSINVCHYHDYRWALRAWSRNAEDWRRSHACQRLSEENQKTQSDCSCGSGSMQGRVEDVCSLGNWVACDAINFEKPGEGVIRHHCAVLWSLHNSFLVTVSACTVSSMRQDSGYVHCWVLSTYCGTWYVFNAQQVFVEWQIILWVYSHSCLTEKTTGIERGCNSETSSDSSGHLCSVYSCYGPRCHPGLCHHLAH